MAGSPESSAAYPFPWPGTPGARRQALAFDVPFTVANLQAAYARGIFPWPGGPADPVPWVSPDPRAVLEFARLHVPRSLRQAQRRVRHLWSFTIDAAFTAVIRACAAAPRRGQDGTWIHPPMIEAYSALHAAGQAHSVEVWEQGRLIGGLYGVDLGGVFGGESMFHLRPNASKLALLHLIDHLSARGATWIDIQQLTPHLAALGAREIRRPEFLRRLRAAQNDDLRLFAPPAAPAPATAAALGPRCAETRG
jgi:leucyl/phenylalanyl-tRNA--protein transferase